ncbi:MAG: tRNA dihydrouridine synthase DusB [Desulfobacterota bacterium]|nr:tRNA dihydrouridine synthase DusB [Thermodesulfobacteriota bacterium]
MRIGPLQLSNNLVLAPMAGITDYPFRQVAREMGCGLTVTEMVSADGLVRKGPSFLKRVRGEHPLLVQLFGSNPEVLAEAAAMAEAMGADGIDLNMGCPAKQVIQAEAGVALMRSPEKVRRILQSMRKRICGVLTVKIRSGWSEEEQNAVEIARIAEDCGVDAITVHPRTRTQGFRGKADWTVIEAVKRTVRIPVIGNGDVKSHSLIRKMVDETGCDGVMIGRGALGNPWIFHEGSSDSGEGKSPLPFETRRLTLLRHLSLIEDYYEEREVAFQMRKHLIWYTKGLPHCTIFHARLFALKEKEQVREAADSYFDSLLRRGPWR